MIKQKVASVTSAGGCGGGGDGFAELTEVTELNFVVIKKEERAICMYD